MAAKSLDRLGKTSLHSGDHAGPGQRPGHFGFLRKVESGLFRAREQACSWACSCSRHQVQSLALGGVPASGTEWARPAEVGMGKKALVYPYSLVRVVALAHSGPPSLPVGSPQVTAQPPRTAVCSEVTSTLLKELS